MKVVWNAIVRNESAILPRCLDSLVPQVDGAIVVDTGSTDGTQQLIQQAFEAVNKPVELHSCTFENFSQARNEALRVARASEMDYDFLLLADADMELCVSDPNWKQQLNGELAFDLKQTAGTLVYYNKRLLSRKSDAIFECPTHEYLAVESSGQLTGIEFKDHADGANRTGKLERDIRLLEAALTTETRPGLVQRIHFYLANSFYELGKFEQALIHYKRRVGLGGWDEEVFYAQMRLAICYERLGEHAYYLLEMLKAYSLRPKRLETLHELARFFRERGENFASLLFSDPGRGLPLPEDQLFVNDVRQHLKEDFSICAYYDESRRSEGAKVCNELALYGSEQARANLFWYLQPLAAHVPSFTASRIAFKPPKGWAAMNPSVINCAQCDNSPIVLIRTVNYQITPEGCYVMRDGSDGPVIIRTRNWIMRLGRDGSTGSFAELLPPLNLPEPLFPLVLGFEDSRLFSWRGGFWTLSTVRELTHEGWCEQVLAPIRCDGTRWNYGENWQRILPSRRTHEKNWMPWVRGGDLQFVYRLGTLVDLQGEEVAKTPSRWELEHISGGSQVVEVAPKLYLAIVHEARCLPGCVARYYQHRFVLLQEDGSVTGISPPFYFFDRQIEFAAGLALFGKQLMVSFGVRDEEAWCATMDLDQVTRFIE